MGQLENIQLVYKAKDVDQIHPVAMYGTTTCTADGDMVDIVVIQIPPFDKGKPSQEVRIDLQALLMFAAQHVEKAKIDKIEQMDWKQVLGIEE